jgi:hemerythrin-like metal-binding protein
MTLLEWKEQYSLGNEALDHEHKELIRLINAVHDEIEKAGSTEDQARVVEGMEEILSAVSAHFALEEKEMQSSHYEEFTNHKADHEKLLDELYDLVEVVETTGIRDIREGISAILGAWFSVHFQTFDRDYHLASKGSDQ